jgi:hypothetical protein
MPVGPIRNRFWCSRTQADSCVSERTTWRSSPRCAVVDVLEARRTLQPAIAQTPFQPAILAPVPLTVDRQPEPFLKAQPLRVGAFLLFAESFGDTA